MNSSHCLNCSNPVVDRYCSRCGQKTDTHRITLNHFLFHDLLHGVWHIDKGILFTIKQTFTRPGQAALEYIEGKRIRYYNVFYLCLIFIGFTLLLNSIVDTKVPDVRQEGETIEEFQRYVETRDFLKTYTKLLIFTVVPVFALIALLMFRRLRLNFAEHCIIGGINLLGILIINLFYLVFYLLDGMYGFMLFGILEAMSIMMILGFPAYVYFGAMKKHYTKLEFSWRMFVFYLLFSVLAILVTRTIYFIITGEISIFGQTF